MTEPSLKRTIKPLSAIFLVVSAIVGSGVFKKVAPMTAELHSPALVLLCWTLAGILSMMGALSTAELTSMMPGSGGEYVYFKKIYGRFFSFLYGWGNLVVMKSATIAALAYIFSDSLHSVIPAIHGLGGYSIQVVASMLIITLSFVNHRGVSFGEKLSRYFIIGIVLAILGFVVLAVTSGKGDISHFTAETPNVPTGWGLFAAMFAASLSAFWGYEGWNNIGFVGEEIKNPQRNLPLALGVGTLVVMTLYLLINTVYLYILPAIQIESLAKNQIAAVETARVLGGDQGAILLSVLIVLTTFNCTNGTILLSARIIYALASDKLFFKRAAVIHPVYNTPSFSIMIQAAWAIVLVWSGSFDTLTDLLIFASFLFYGASAFGVILFRKNKMHRPYKVPLWIPAVFSVFCLILVTVTIYNKPVQALIGLLLISSGIPLYFYFNSRLKVQ
ncbi:Serine/threonine exchanger SteT [Dyadobacter sp. CECT 9275]|uniref:Serine/threonine exchanger SteT n=1 Tax=Dyadobacter helix TaxID=2822344 RepID=A0A916JIU4_9BACT|nr:amino acid permease [Dyadobacter sp. CECT 9275]CAG5018656.1 Serine/threonine exchanger SteT [Dyadobacter sp. CECT 9275]